MSEQRDPAAPDSLPMSDHGPWGGRGSNGGSGGGDNGRPRNPWTPPPEGPKSPRGGGGPSLEELFRKGVGRFPFNTGNRPIWPYVIPALLVLWIVFTGVHRLDPEQQGVVTRFGAFSRVVGPGISLTLPSPIEQLAKVDTQQIRTTAIGSDGGASENLVLTSDQNIIDMAYEIRWSIKNPTAYLFQLANPEETVRDVAESAMRASVANFSLSQAIGPGRSDIEARVRTRMQQILDSYRAGITIESIAVRESDPPAEVVEAFKNVNAAKQRRESYLNDARAYSERVTQRAEADTTAFDKVYTEYALAPEVTKRRMYYETMESVLGSVDKTIVETPGVTPYLPLPEIGKRAAAAADVPAKPPAGNARAVPGGGQ